MAKTAGRLPRGAALALALGLAAGCTKSAGDDAVKYDRAGILAAVGPNVVLPALRVFASRADSLETAAAALDKAVAAGSGADAARTAARAAFAAAVRAWQRLEPMQIGPAAAPGTRAGGKGLRDAIYAWPAARPCSVDQQTASRAYAGARFFETSQVDSRGLDAIEYLLYAAAGRNACPSGASINRDGTWAKLGAAEVARRRAAYAALAAADVKRRARALLDAWDPKKGDFSGDLARAGRGSRTYRTARQAVDDLFGALFYLDRMVKDRKLARPAGIDGTCKAKTCPEDVEHAFAKLGRDAIVENLEGARRLILGGEPGKDGKGFDDALKSLGEGALFAKLDGQLTTALARARKLPADLAAALSTHMAGVVALHDAIREVTATLKGRFSAVLTLDVPAEGAGDAD